MQLFFKQSAVLASGILALLASGVAHADVSLPGVIAQGRAIIDLRARYETVQDASRTRDANGGTLRARLGYETGAWNSLQVAFDFDQVWTVGGATYNSTRNGKTTYPVILDPAMTALNRLQVTYASDFDTKFTLGRQRLLIGNQRFIGNVGWRQHEQTYDAISAVNTTIKDLTFSYAYLHRVNRVGGPSHQVPANTAAAATGQASYFKSASHVMDAVYTGFAGLRLEAYAFLLDFGAPSYAAAPAQQLAAARLDTATYGGRADYSFPLADHISGKLTGEFAHQTNYANNPVALQLNYWLGEGSLSYAGLTGLVGYEVLEGDGTIGFATPLATLHAFNGWADMFLVTPINGLKDLYVKAVYALPADFIEMKSLTGIVTYHDYSSDKVPSGIGSEWNVSAELAVDNNVSLLAKYAAYNGGGVAFGGFADKSVFWLQAAYKY